MEKAKKQTIKCLKLNSLAIGECITKDSKRLEVKNILPNEEAIVETSYERNFIKTKILSITNPSKSRAQVKCPIYEKCGSCQLLHMNYDSQIEFKKQLVLDCFKKEHIPVKIDEIIKADTKIGYRNKLQVAFRNVNGKVVCGFYEEGTHKIIPMTNCQVHSLNQLKIVETVKNLIIKMKIAPYDEDRRTGHIRFLLIREAFVNKEMLVTIVTNSEVFPGRGDFIKSLVHECPFITTIVQNINPRKTSIILGDNEKVLYGKGYIEEYLCGIKFKLSSKSFFQINQAQTEKLYNKVKEFGEFKGTETILDTYCGVGTIGITLASSVKEVLGVENNKQAYYNAISNARDNKLKNVHFVNADATEFIEGFAKENVKVDCLIMDPPRTGSTERFISTVCKLKPKKVIYVSCGPDTLARDLKSFVKDYKITKTAICDLFVGTYHIETVVTLVLRDGHERSQHK